MITILIVDDDESLRTVLSEKVSQSYNVLVAQNGEEGLKVFFEKQIDLVIADIMMPKIDGFEFVKVIRAANENIPILMMTAKHDFSSKNTGFSLGVDDYMTKPVNLDELMLRIKALLRRYRINAEQKIKIGGFKMNATTYEVEYGGEQIEMPGKQFDLLYLLLSYPNQLFTKSKLMEKVWGYDSKSDDTTLRTHINMLRNKLTGVSEFEIITIKGLGYKAVIKNEG